MWTVVVYLLVFSFSLLFTFINNFLFYSFLLPPTFYEGIWGHDELSSSPQAVALQECYSLWIRFKMENNHDPDTDIEK